MTALFNAGPFAALAFVLSGALVAAPARAQADFPSRAVRIVVPFAPGGASDAIARPLAQGMSAALGQTVIVENRAGAAGNIALDLVVRAPADGTTMLLGNISTNAMNQTSYASTLKVVPTRDLTAVGLVGPTPSVLVASMVFPATNAQTFISHARAHPGKINYWLPGVASGPHFEMVKLENHLGVKMTSVPYSGGAGPGINALISGQVDIGLVNLGSALPHIKAGKLRALAVSTPQRLPELPEVPTAAEAGLGSFSGSWQALFVHSATPKAVVQRLHAAMNEALHKGDIKEAITRAATIVSPSASPDEAQAWVVGETQRWAKIITELGIRPEQ